MSFSAGDRIGPYEILAKLGAGGMGEVFRARDTRLGRDVAIKICAERFSERFEREARAVAALNHPNICTLYDVGPNYLVMEMVEGPTLAARIAHGALPIEEARAIAGQIAAALEAAQEKSIVHRDLKPANIKVKPDGTVKVLDFGLAKMPEPVMAGAGESSPTLTLEQATRAGIVLGTAAYMAPEQARGKPVDQRADIWAFGVVLYEMLTGRRLFQGETVSDTLAAVLKEEPHWNQIPAPAERLIRRCLEKDPQRRLRHIGDALPYWEETPGAVPAAPGRWPWLATAAGVLALIAASTVAVSRLRESPLPPEVVRFQIPFPEHASPTPGETFAVSPNGRVLAFAADTPGNPSRLWIRNLDTLEAHPLAATDSLGAGYPPIFWSPDSQFVAYWNGQQLKKVGIAGGPPQFICDSPKSIIGGSWNGDGTIVFAAAPGGLMRVPAAGGTPVLITEPDSSRAESAHLMPSFLPGGRAFLYFRNAATGNGRGIYTGSLDQKPGAQNLQRLLDTHVGAIYVSVPHSESGRVLFLRDTTLLAQPFDLHRLELAGEPVALAENVDSFAAYGHFSASETGVLVYRTGSGQSLRPTWINRQGDTLSSAGDAAFYSSMSLSPNGSQAAIVKRETGDIWLLDFTRGSNARFTLGQGTSDFPVWSPDGKEIVFAKTRGGSTDLYRKPVSGARDEQVLLHSAAAKTPSSWSRDGRYLLYTVQAANDKSDIWILPMLGGSQPVPLLHSEFNEHDGRFSPDGHWIAYTSNESGAPEVYVREFSESSPEGPRVGGKWLVSKGGGSQPRWRGDSKELFYRSATGVMAVNMSSSPSLEPGVPKTMLSTTILSGWDITSDGQRILVALGQTTEKPVPFTVVLNWPAALKK